ncbi:hypothetical protein KCU99_g4610, partial [Aureobasidium melanogenum]
MQPPRCCWHRIQHYRTPQGFALLRSSTDTIPLLTTGMAKVLPYHHDGEVDVNHVGDISRSATAEHFVLPPRPEKGGTYSPVISPAYSINNDFDSFSDTDQPANFTTSADDVDDIAELEMSRDAQELPKTAHLDSQNPSFVEPKVNTEHRGRGIKASTQEVPMPVLPLAVHALSRTQLCLSGIDATIGAFPSSFPRHTSSTVHPVLSSLISLPILSFLISQHI